MFTRVSPYYAFWRKLKYILFNDKSPVVASIKITQKCNLRCAHCTWVNKIKEDLSYNKWIEIIDDLYNKGCVVIFFEGGEPTLRSDLGDLINYVKKKGMICILFTNGTRDISSYNPDAVWISIDGVKKSGDILRGKGVFEKILKTIENNQNKTIFSITTICKENIDELDLICNKLSETSLSGLIFNFAYQYRDVSISSLTIPERKDCAKNLIHKKIQYPKIASSNSYLEMVGQKDKICYPWMLTVVTADGKQVHGCTVEPMEKKDCSQCDMMCGLESSLGFDLKRDSVDFWNKTKVLPRIDYYPDWLLNLLKSKL